MLAQLLHVQVASARQPLLRLLDRQCRHQPQARLPVGEDPHHPRPSLQLLVEPLQPVGGADAPTGRLGEGQAGEALLDVLLYVAGDLLVALTSLPLGHAGGELEGGASVRRGEDTA